MRATRRRILALEAPDVGSQTPVCKLSFRILSNEWLVNQLSTEPRHGIPSQGAGFLLESGPGLHWKSSGA